MMLLFFWVFFAILVGVFASNRRGRSGGGWFLLSLLISPLLAFLFAVVCKNLLLRRCPICAEDIKREARICLHCHYELPREPVKQALPSSQRERIEMLKELNSA